MSAPTAPSATDDNGIRAKTLRGLLLARELDGARQARGFSTRTLATAMSMSPAMVNRVMTGRRVPTALEIGGLCAVLDIPAHRRPVLYHRTATAEQTEWILHPDDERGPLRDLELLADTITWFAPDLIPRPLRTGDYARALDDDPGTERAGPRRNRFFLHPFTLGHPAIPADVLRGQLRHLLGNPAVRLLPAGVDRRPAFRVLAVERFPSIVHIEHLGTDFLVEHPGATSAHTAFLRHLDATALSATETRDELMRALGP